MLDALIEKRRERGIDILVSKFDHSDHVLHFYLIKPNEYNRILDRVLEVVARAYY